MQSKALVRVFAVMLAVVCAFYLSFSWVTSKEEKKIDEIAQTQGEDAAMHYRDSVMTTPIYMWSYNLKQCQEMQIGLGLDLKGGMNVVLEVSIPDVVIALADHKEDADFRNAIAAARQDIKDSHSGDFIDLFIKHYNKPLAPLFATQQLRGKVNTTSTDAQVENVLRAEVKAAVDNAYNVLRTRIDRFGVAQPNIQTLEGQMGRIMVEMPGVKEVERVRKLLQGSANLEFWETYNSNEVSSFIAQLNARLAQEARLESPDTTAAKAEPAAEEKVEAVTDSAKAANDLAAVLAGNKGDKPAQSKEEQEKARLNNPLFSHLQPMNYGGCIVGIAHKNDTAAVNDILRSNAAKEVLPSDLRLMWGVKASDNYKGEVYELYAIRVTERNGRAPLEGDVVVDAKDEFDQMGRPCVSMSMNTDGARRWAALTKANIKRSVAIVLDGFVYSAPTVQNEITGGNSQITGNFTLEDTKDLGNVLKSGKMPAPAYIVSEDIVGPSLGAESIRIGAWSFVIALIILALYMVVMYGVKGGLVADCALALNAFFTLGILTSFQAALTMSGIAGLVLSLGMAVDANVLIYERTKEELRAGKKIAQALSDGYSNAFSAIFDSNLTSIITGVILFNFGTGPVRGFATTLIIGICVSFFTAVFLTRLVYEWHMKRDKWQDLTLSTPLARYFSFDDQRVRNFMGSYKTSFGIFGALILVGIAAYAIRGFSQSIDFTGGRNFTVMFEQAVTPEDVNGVITNAFPEANNQVTAIGTDGKTLRISTNYNIDKEGVEADAEIETKMYEALKQNNLISCELETFINRDVRDGGSIISSQKVGPSVAEDITWGAFWSVLLALAAIAIYISIRFRNITFAAGAIVALTADTLIILGAYALLWGFMPFSLEIDQTFIGAVLTAIGYSINDKVVVFDRLREYLHLYPKRDRQLLFNQSLTSTLNRTVNTSVSTAIVLVVIICGVAFGGSSSIASFAFAMLLGVVFGTFSSMFIAAPVAYLLHSKNKSIVTEE